MSIDDLYLAFFGLGKHPFRLTPDADFMYLSAEHARAKACVEQASVSRGAVVIVSGEVGCGKSVLINKIMAEMPAGISVARLTQTHLDVDELLQSLLTQFGFRPFDRSKEALRSLLDNFLFAQSMRGHRVLIIIEEAQNLSQAALRELEELADLEEDGERLISVVLVGQPRLQERFGENELKRLVARAKGKVHLEALDQQDTRQLIDYRLRVAGCGDPPFDSETYAEIYRYTGGVPRVIVNLCDTALTAAYVEDSPRVTPELLAAAIEELELKAVAEASAEQEQTDDGEGEPSCRRAYLRVHNKHRHLYDLDINDTRVMLGRDPDNDAVLRSEFISRHHAQISLDPDGRYWIKDLNSTNGVFINARRVKRALIHDGDTIRLGRHVINFVDNRVAGSGASVADSGEWRETSVLDVAPVDGPEGPGEEPQEPQVSSGHS